MTLDQRGVHATVFDEGEVQKTEQQLLPTRPWNRFGLFQGRVLQALSQILRPWAPRVTTAAAADMHRAPGHTSQSPPSIGEQ